MMDYETDRAFKNRLRKIQRHGRWILAGTALAGLTAFVISLFLPKTYQATTYVLVSESKIGPSAPTPSWQYALLATYVPFVDNDALIARAIRRFHLDQPPYNLTLQKFREKDCLDVRIPKSTRLLEIEVEFPDAKLAADLANFLAQGAVDFNDQINTSDTLTTQKFMQQRLDQATAHLAEAEARRLEVRRKARIEDREKVLSIMLNQKEQVSTQLEQFGMALAQNDGRAKSLEQALGGEPRTFQLQKSVTSDRFLEHAAEKAGFDKPGDLSATEEVLNTTRAELERQFADATANAEAARRGVQEAERRLQEMEAQINRLLADVTELRSEIDKAERDFSLAREAFEGASRDVRNASVVVSAKTQDLKQVAPALVPEKPTRPKIVLNTILGLLLGFLLLTGIALFLEGLREVRAENLTFDAEREPVHFHRS